jgi:hypothetical protein
MPIPRRETSANKQFLDPANLQLVARRIIETVQPMLTPPGELEIIDNPLGSYFSLVWRLESGIDRFSLTASNDSKGSINYLEIYFRDHASRSPAATWYVGPPQDHTCSEVWATVIEGKSRQPTMLELDFRFRSHLVVQEPGHELLTANIVRTMQRSLNKLKLPT